MRNLILAVGAASMALPVNLVLPSSDAEAHASRYHRQSGRTYAYREWRGRDGRTYCRRSNGTVGLVVGAAGGALIGRAIDTRGERATGTILGAAGGALIGREVVRKRRCR